MKRIFLNIGIGMAIGISIVFLIFAYFAIDDYLEDYYCIKSGGIGYDEMFNGCGYMARDFNYVPNSFRDSSSEWLLAEAEKIEQKYETHFDYGEYNENLAIKNLSGNSEDHKKHKKIVKELNRRGIFHSSQDQENTLDQYRVNEMEIKEAQDSPAKSILALGYPFTGKLFIQDTKYIQEFLKEVKETKHSRIAELNKLDTILGSNDTTQKEKEIAKIKMLILKDQFRNDYKKMDDVKRATIQNQIEQVGNVVDILVEHGIRVVEIGTDEENHSVKVSIHRENLTLDRIIIAKKIIRSAIGNDVDLTIAYSELISFNGSNHVDDN